MMEPLRAMPDWNNPYKGIEDVDLSAILTDMAEALENDPTRYTHEEVFGPLLADVQRRRLERAAMDEAV